MFPAKTRQHTLHRVATTSQTWQPRCSTSRWAAPTQALNVVALFSKTHSTSMTSTTRQLARSPITLSPCWITYPQTPGSTMCLSWLKAILVSRRVASSCRMELSVRTSTSKSIKLLIRALETHIIMVKTLSWLLVPVTMELFTIMTQAKQWTFHGVIRPTCSTWASAQSHLGLSTKLQRRPTSNSCSVTVRRLLKS